MTKAAQGLDYCDELTQMTPDEQQHMTKLAQELNYCDGPAAYQVGQAMTKLAQELNYCDHR